MDDIQVLLSRRQYARGTVDNWVRILRRAYMLSQPNRNVFQYQRAEGANKSFETYDSELVIATRRFVNKIQQALAPSSINWVQFVPGDELIANDLEDKLSEQLQAITNHFFRFLNRSNFAPALNSALYDMAVWTGVLMLNEGDDDNPLEFAAVPADRVCFCEGKYGTIDAVFRDYVDMPVAVAIQTWNGFQVPAGIVGQRNEYEVKMTLYECSYYDYKTKTYFTKVIDSRTKKVCWEREEESWPWLVFRWYVLPGEIGGRGPVMDAYCTAATLNKAFEDELLAADLKSKPIYMGFSDNIFNPNTFKLVSGTAIPVSPIAGNTWPIQPLPNAGDPQFAAIVIADLRNQINNIMYTMNLGPIESTPPVTATEILVRQQQVQQDAGASFDRLQRELFEPLIKRVIYILRKKGKWNELKVDGKVIDLKFQTPLQLSKGQIDTNDFVKYKGMLDAILGPQLSMGTLNLSKIPHKLAKNLNIDLSLVKTELEIQQAMKKAEAQMKQMQQQGEM